MILASGIREQCIVGKKKSLREVLFAVPILGRPQIPIPKIIMEIGSELYPGIPGLRTPHDIIARRLSPPYKKVNFEKWGGVIGTALMI